MEGRLEKRFFFFLSPALKWSSAAERQKLPINLLVNLLTESGVTSSTKTDGVTNETHWLVPLR